MKEDDRVPAWVRARRPTTGEKGELKGDELTAVGPTRPGSEISEGGAGDGGSFSHIDHTTLASLYEEPRHAGNT